MVCRLSFMVDTVENHGKRQINCISDVQTLCSPVVESLVWLTKYDSFLTNSTLSGSQWEL